MPSYRWKSQKWKVCFPIRLNIWRWNQSACGDSIPRIHLFQPQIVRSRIFPQSFSGLASWIFPITRLVRPVPGNSIQIQIQIHACQGISNSAQRRRCSQFNFNDPCVRKTLRQTVPWGSQRHGCGTKISVEIRTHRDIKTSNRQASESKPYSLTHLVLLNNLTYSSTVGLSPFQSVNYQCFLRLFFFNRRGLYCGAAKKLLS